MATIKGEIPEELEQEFRKIVANKYGLKKGNISLALRKAIEDWIMKQKEVMNDTNNDKDQVVRELRKTYPGKFIAINHKNKVVTVAEDIIVLYEKLDPEQEVGIIAPSDINSGNAYSKRQLGSRIKRKLG